MLNLPYFLGLKKSVLHCCHVLLKCQIHIQTLHREGFESTFDILKANDSSAVPFF